METRINYKTTYENTNVINMLLSNPVFLLGEPILPEPNKNTGKKTNFYIFLEKDLNLGFEGDQLIILSEDASFLKVEGKKEKAIAKFEAFFLPAIADETTSAKVPPDVNFIMTSSLSGCTFLAEKNASTPKVAHINKRDNNDQIDLLATEQEIQSIVGDKADQYFIVRKKDYITEKIAGITTAFGLKLEDKWYYFCVSTMGNKFTVISTLPNHENKIWEMERNARTILLNYRDELSKQTMEPEITSANHSPFIFKVKKPVILDKSNDQLEVINLALKGSMKWTVALKIVNGLRAENKDQPIETHLAPKKR